MIQDCERGEIDLILVKSISRFYRNTAECIVMVRKLRELRVGILFEKEGIDTMKERDEFWLTILSSFAQSESETLSRNLKLGYRQAFQAGTFKVNFKRLYGYKLTP